MYQIDNSTVAATQPPSSAPGTAGFFTDGNPATNVPATIVPAEYMNAIMLEIMNAITGSGQALNKSAFNQLWTAIQNTSKNPGVTPPQFDNSTNTSTTAFVQRALGNFRSTQTYAASTVLTTANAGQLVIDGTSGAASTYTLPATAAMPGGAAISFLATSANGMIIVCAGSDKITIGGQVGGVQVTTLTLKVGDTLTLVSNGVNSYFVQNGSAQLPYSGLFAASFAGSGYQKFPSGLIIQWGTSAASANNAASPITLPLTFPTGALFSSACVYGQPGGTGISVGSSISTTQITLYNSFTAAQTLAWLALGH